MSNISIQNSKWVEIYNSIVLLSFFMEEYQNSPASIQKINDRLNRFCSEKQFIGKDFTLEGGLNMFAFCYLIIARTIELLNVVTNKNTNVLQQFFKWVMETAKLDGLKSFPEIITRYDCQLVMFAYSSQSDELQLYEFFRHIRHAISHFSYDVDSSLQKVRLTSINRSQQTELDVIIPMHQMINLTAHFGYLINNTIHQRGLLT